LTWAANGSEGFALATESRIADGDVTVTASEFEAACLKLMDEVTEGGREVVITRGGRPVARLVSCQEESSLAFGRNRDNIEIHGDIVSPMPAEWFEDPDYSDDGLFQFS